MATVNRRTVVRGAAWAAPAIIATATVPAYAASRCVTGSMSYNNADFQVSAQGHQESIISSGSVSNTVTTTVATAGYAYTKPTNTLPVYNAMIGMNGYTGLSGTTGVTTQAKTGQLGGADNMKPALVLTQARTTPTQPSTQTVTYTFAKPIYSFSLDIVDLTYIAPNSSAPLQVYRDVISFNVPIASLTGATSNNLSATSGPAGTQFYRTSSLASVTDGSLNTTLTATATFTQPITSFTITYTDNLTQNTGWQYIGFSNLSVCSQK